MQLKIDQRVCTDCKEVFITYGPFKKRCPPPREWADEPLFSQGAPAVLKARLASIKMAHGCTDCGYAKEPTALEFDHVCLPMDKEEAISRMVVTGACWQKVCAELAKCEVVCANCHRERTAKRVREMHRNQQMEINERVERQLAETIRARRHGYLIIEVEGGPRPAPVGGEPKSPWRGDIGTRAQGPYAPPPDTPDKEGYA